MFLQMKILTISKHLALIIWDIFHKNNLKFEAFQKLKINAQNSVRIDSHISTKMLQTAISTFKSIPNSE